MRQGEVWLVGLDPAAGHEQRGVRPVLIVSATEFNRRTRVPVVLPITTGGGFARRSGFAVSLEAAGGRTHGVVRCDQPRALDLAARGGRRVERLPEPLLQEVLARLRPIFDDGSN